MELYYACQNQTYSFESADQYLWSPQKTKDGKNNVGYVNMSRVKKGDIIFHGAEQQTYAISIAKSDCYEAIQPLKNRAVAKEPIWEDKGYQVDTDYTILTTPVNMKEISDWLKKHPFSKESAFTVHGTCKEVYLNCLHKNHAKYIVNRALKLQQNKNVIAFLKYVLEDILGEEYGEYDDNEKNEINQIVDDTIASEKKPSWKGVAGEQRFSNESGTHNRKPKRSAKVAANALVISNYECEYDHDPARTFFRKSGAKYTEPHHLIPISKYEDFEFEKGKFRNLDVEENIVSLCSYCHNLLHYGRPEDKLPILKNLYDARKEALKNVGIEIADVNELIKYYE